MQILVMLAFLAVYLLVLWFGSIALEATGMERSRSRFQALSALTGTGFTTSQAELIVEHAKRRQIVTYLILLGNTGIVAFIILVILSVRAGLTLPSISISAFTIVVLLFIGLAFWLGLIDRLTNAILRLTGRKTDMSRLIVEKVVHSAGDYAVVRLAVDEQSPIAGRQVQDADFKQRSITVLAIERGDAIVSLPQPEEKVLSGDYILCYGRLSDIEYATKKE